MTDESDPTKLWQLIVAEQHLTFVQRWDNGKPVEVPRWPREARRLANECKRLSEEVERLQRGLEIVNRLVEQERTEQ